MKTLAVRNALAAVGLTLATCMAAPAFAAEVFNGSGLPAGNVILDLAGTKVPPLYAPYFVNFTATSSKTAITFAFRDDDDWFYLDDIQVRASVLFAPNLLVNGGFEGGVTALSTTTHTFNEPNGWVYSESDVARDAAVEGGAESSVALLPDQAHTGSDLYIGHGAGGFDAITQDVATTAGATYLVSFWLSASDFTQENYTFSHNANAPNGYVDLAVLADPVSGGATSSGALGGVPEPVSWALMIAGFGLVGASLRNARKAGLAAL